LSSRKKAKFDEYYKSKPKPSTPQHLWLRKKISKSILEKISKVLSPNMIARLLGVQRPIIMNLADEYNVDFLMEGIT